MSEESISSKDIVDKLLHILDIYPVLSHTMLQAALGPKIPSRVWKPVMDQLVTEGKIKVDTIVAKNTTGRHITYTRISLA